MKVFAQFRITYRYLSPILIWTISPPLQRLHSRTAGSIPNIWIPRWNIMDLCHWLRAMETILTGRLHLAFPHPVIFSKFERNDRHMLNETVIFMVFVISHCFSSNHSFIKKYFYDMRRIDIGIYSRRYSSKMMGEWFKRNRSQKFSLTWK